MVERIVDGVWLFPVPPLDICLELAAWPGAWHDACDRGYGAGPVHSVAAGASACSGCTPGTYSSSSGAYRVFKVGQHYVFLLLKGRRGKAEAMAAVVRHQQVANKINFF